MSGMFTRRRLLTLGAGALVVGPFLAACGGGGSAPPPAAKSVDGAQSKPAAPAAAATTPAQTTDAPKADSPAKPGVVTLRFMKFAGPGWIHDEQFTKQFMEENPNVEVKIEEIIYGEMYKKSLALGATGTLADIFAGHNRWTPYQGFKGLCLDLDPLVKAHGQEIDFEDFFPSVIEDGRGLGSDGKLYWLPTVVHSGGNAVVAFNMDLMEQAGVQAPTSKDWTIEEYEQIVRAAAKPGDGIYGTDINMAAPLYAAQALRSWSSNPQTSTDDSWLISRDGKKQQLESPPVKEGYEWYRRLIGDGLVPSSGEKQAMESSGVNHFVAGKMVTRAAEGTTPITYMDQIGDRFRMEIVLWPKGPNGHRGSALSYNNQMIFAQTQHQEEAWKLLGVLTGKEHAFQKGFDGTGQAGARRSAWFNPKLWEKFPITQDIAEWFEEGIDPYPRPWNLRAQEHQEIYVQEIQAYLDGKETWDEMIAHVQPRGQEIVDLPRP